MEYDRSQSVVIAVCVFVSSAWCEVLPRCRGSFFHSGDRNLW